MANPEAVEAPVKLKPCPLCHGTNIDTDRYGPEFPLSVVWCRDCGCTVDDCSECESTELPFDRWQNRLADRTSRK